VKKHLVYLSYLIRHKWFVFIAGIKVECPIWQLIIHDWSKFTPSEWSGYVNHFYVVKKHGCKVDGKLCEECSEMEIAFDYAWLHHYNHNPHHWNGWILRGNGKVKILEMPDKYILELFADWMGANRTINGKWKCLSGWYAKNKQDIHFAPETKKKVEELFARYIP